MKYLTGEDRQQIPLFVGCLEEAIEAVNEVRLVDAFLASLCIGDICFKVWSVRSKFSNPIIDEEVVSL